MDDREAADTLRGGVCQIPAAQRRALGEAEFWPDDLSGATAVGPGGETLGTVAGVEFDWLDFSCRRVRGLPWCAETVQVISPLRRSTLYSRQSN